MDKICQTGQPKYLLINRRYSNQEKEVPSGRQTEVVVTVVIPVVVDIEPIRIEVAHVDAVAIGVHELPTLIYITGD